ncbi:glucose-1-phosphate adenylyltransferase [Candidatus Woesearchaeota archaeon]|nr:glucose-1-phosphate adenylyltransferase [Candidatus Woesearchaeota archaeon]
MSYSNINVVAYVMAGGEGSRLRPLTNERAKPAVPFAGMYRIIDFVMTNLSNSGVHKIVLLTQYKPGSLSRHIQQGYLPVFSSLGRFLEPRQSSKQQYMATADSVFQNLDVLSREHFDIVDVFGADHIYRMNVTQMHDSHLNKKADVTISVMPVSIDDAARFGVVTVNKEGRITKFEEKPIKPTPMPLDHTKCLASMGNYSFNPKSLEGVLQEQPKDKKQFDFGHYVIPKMIKDKRRVFAYDFSKNSIEGFTPEEVTYWRDVGTIPDYYRAHMDLLGENPVLKLQLRNWRMLTNVESTYPSRGAGRVYNVDYVLANGAWLHDEAVVKSSVISYDVEVKNGAEVLESIMLGHTEVGEGALIRKSIIDRWNNIPAKTIIGVDKGLDRERGFSVEGDITTVPRGHFPFK